MAPVYSYMFAACFDYAGGRAPWHCADIPFFFHNTERAPYAYSVLYREALERQMVQSFVNFAKNADPNNNYMPKWTPSTEKDLYTMVFDERTEQRVNYDDELIGLLQSTVKMPSFFGVTPDEDEEADSDRRWLY